MKAQRKSQIEISIESDSEDSDVPKKISKTVIHVVDKPKTMSQRRRNKADNTIHTDKQRTRKAVRCEICGVPQQNIWRHIKRSHGTEIEKKVEDKVVSSKGYITYVCLDLRKIKGCPPVKCRKLVEIKGSLVREVYAALLSLNVGVNNVEKVVRTVLEKLGGLKVERLPKRTFSEIMLVEAKALAQMQAAEAMLTSECNTLHTDGTKKGAHEFGGVQVGTSFGQLSLGINEMVRGDAESFKLLIDFVLTDMSKILVKIQMLIYVKKVGLNLFYQLKTCYLQIRLEINLITLAVDLITHVTYKHQRIIPSVV
ncbi:unnamed protein product [Mytilus edulis]|uniref:Uncharacterized protein n=1 Tax=Mytilus edulis TaxID=6550 RepID=A0A8S3SIZ3_MYTED|nr:unnamed protein product [Mytilus edulis]